MILTDKRLAELRATAMRQCYSCGGYNEYEPCPTIVNMDGDEILALIDDLASLRANAEALARIAYAGGCLSTMRAAELTGISLPDIMHRVQRGEWPQQGELVDAERKALRALREACQTVVMDIGYTSFDDATVEAEVEQWYGRLKKALAACQKEMIDDRT